MNLKISTNSKIACLTAGIVLWGNSIIVPQKARAMWVWNSANQVTNMINNVGSYREDIFNFCKAPHGNSDHKISVLFLSCRQAVYDNSDNLRNFLSEASDSGLTIEYLDGDPSWATYNQSVGFERIEKVIEFNSKSSTEKEKIKGIHFDVEPYLLKQGSSYRAPYWDTDLMTVWGSYMNYADSCQLLVDGANQNLYFGIAIPRWYENYVGVDELKKLQGKVDYVAIMDYNESSSVIINDAANEINNAKELSKKVWIGVETKQVSPETVSFYEEGVAYMESQLDNVYAAYGNEPVFSGFAIHSYNYYRDLKNGTVSVKKNEFAENANFTLNQNYPNPFNPETVISYLLPVAGQVSLRVFDLLGREVASLVSEFQQAGSYNLQLSTNHNQLTSGVYYYRLQAGSFVQTKKMVVLK